MPKEVKLKDTARGIAQGDQTRNEKTRPGALPEVVKLEKTRPRALPKGFNQKDTTKGVAQGGSTKMTRPRVLPKGVKLKGLSWIRDPRLGTWIKTRPRAFLKGVKIKRTWPQTLLKGVGIRGHGLGHCPRGSN